MSSTSKVCFSDGNVRCDSQRTMVSVGEHADREASLDCTCFSDCDVKRCDSRKTTSTTCSFGFGDFAESEGSSSCTSSMHSLDEDGDEEAVLSRPSSMFSLGEQGDGEAFPSRTSSMHSLNEQGDEEAVLSRTSSMLSLSEQGDGESGGLSSTQRPLLLLPRAAIDASSEQIDPTPTSSFGDPEPPRGRAAADLDARIPIRRTVHPEERWDVRTNRLGWVGVFEETLSRVSTSVADSIETLSEADDQQWPDHWPDASPLAHSARDSK